MAAIFPASSSREPIASLLGTLRRQLGLKNCRCHVRHIFLDFPLFSFLEAKSQAVSVSLLISKKTKKTQEKRIFLRWRTVVSHLLFFFVRHSTPENSSAYTLPLYPRLPDIHAWHTNIMVFILVKWVTPNGRWLTLIMRAYKKKRTASNYFWLKRWKVDSYRFKSASPWGWRTVSTCEWFGFLSLSLFRCEFFFFWFALNLNYEKHGEQCQLQFIGVTNMVGI